MWLYSKVILGDDIAMRRLINYDHRTGVANAFAMRFAMHSTPFFKSSPLLR